jgi:hypothetical protein
MFTQHEFEFDSSIIHSDYDMMLKDEGYNAFMKTLIGLHAKGNIIKWIDQYPTVLDCLHDNYTDSGPFAEGFKEALQEASYSLKAINSGIDPLSGETYTGSKQHVLNLYIGLLQDNM